MKRHVVPAILLVMVGGCTGAPPSNPPRSPDPAPFSAQPSRPRAGHTATMLADGRVLLAGGCAVDGCAASEVEPSSEFYVPSRGFVPGPPMRHPRSSHTATLLPDGRVLMVGGWAKEGTAALTEAEMFDPTTGTFQPAGILQGLTTLLPDGRVLIGGSGAGVEFLDPSTGSLTSGPAMPQRRHAASLVLPDGDILITGGLDGPGRGLASTIIYNPDTGDWRPGPELGTPRFKHAITKLDDGRILVLGGTSDDTVLLASTEILDLTANKSTPGPVMTVPRYKFPDAVVRTTTGRLVVAGGTQVDVLAPDGLNFAVIAIGSGAQRWTPTATALPDGTVLFVGGYTDRIRVHRDAHIIRAGP